MRLPVRVRPIEGESFSGYLLRLSVTNGYTTYSELANAIGFSRRVNHCPLESDLLEVSVELAPVLLMSDEEFSLYFRKSYSANWLYGGIRDIRSVYVHQPRICPECLTKGNEPHIKFDWALLPHTHCAIHSRELLDCCPHCHEVLSWNSDLFDGCQKCGFHWKNVDQSFSAIPKWQKTFDELRHENSFAGGVYSWIDGFTSNVLKAARPYDQFHDQIESIPDTLQHINQLIDQAFTPYSVTDDGLLEYPAEGFVKPRRLKHKESIRYHCKADQIAVRLGLRPGERFSALVEQGIVDPIQHTPVLRDMLFDIRDAETLITCCKRLAYIPDGYIGVDGDSDLLARFDTYYGELIAAAIIDDVLVIFSEGVNFELSILPLNWLSEFLERNLRKNCTGNISINRASKILGKTSPEVKDMIGNQDLVEGFSRGINRVITSDSVLNFLDQCRDLKDKKLN
jgi:hypothetical protein